MSHSKLWLFASSMLALSLATPAFAADVEPAAAGPAKIDEVIVTAQKRSENVQRVPLSIVAKTGAQLTQAGVNNVEDLERIVPGLTFTQNSQVSGVAIRVRGFGTAANSSVDSDAAAYIDGVFIPRPGAILSSFLDVSNVEVLRGPQGTLFGRNSAMGAIAITTNAPNVTRQSGEISLSEGSYGATHIGGMVNLPVSDTFAIRAAGFGETFGGFYKNSLDGRTFGAHDTDAGRLSAKWEVTPNLTWIGRADYAQTTGDGFALAQVDTSTATAAQITSYVAHLGGAANAPTLASDPSFTAHQRLDNPSVVDKQNGVASDLTWGFGEGYSLRLIDSFRHWQDLQTDGDVVMTPLDLLNRRGSFTSTSQSHELQLSSPKDKLLGGRLDYVAGLYFFGENYATTSATDFGSQFCTTILPLAGKAGLIPLCQAGAQTNAGVTLFNQRTNSFAGYAQANFKLTDDLTLTLGARESTDRKTGVFSQTNNNALAGLVGLPESDPGLKADVSKPTWRGNLSWQITPRVMAFASVSTGYKSGGFSNTADTGVLPATPAAAAAARTFAPETSTDYELGVKSTFFDRRLQVNADIFQTDLQNFQDRSWNGFGFVIQNLGNIRARGAELDAQILPIDHIKVDISGAYLNSVYSSDPTAPGLPGCSAAVLGSCVGYETIVGGNPTIQNLTGRPADFAPKWQGDAAVEYDSSPFMGGHTLQLRGDVSYVGSMYTTNDDNPQSIVGAHTLLGARVNLVSPDKSWTLSAYGENLTNEKYFTLKAQQPLAAVLGVNLAATGATLLRGYPGAPLTVGVSLKKTF